jgi:hypothetical protein
MDDEKYNDPSTNAVVSSKVKYSPTMIFDKKYVLLGDAKGVGSAAAGIKKHASSKNYTHIGYQMSS